MSHFSYRDFYLLYVQVNCECDLNNGGLQGTVCAHVSVLLPLYMFKVRALFVFTEDGMCLVVCVQSIDYKNVR